MRNNKIRTFANVLLASAAGTELVAWAKDGDAALIVLGVFLFAAGVHQYMRYFGIIK